MHYKKFMKVLEKNDQKFLKHEYWRMAGCVIALGVIATSALDAAYQYGRAVSSVLANTMVKNAGVEPECDEALKDIAAEVDGK